MPVLTQNAYTYHANEGYWLYTDAARDLEVYIAGDEEAMQTVYWENAVGVLDRIDDWIERAQTYAGDRKQIQAGTEGRWFAKWFGFGAPDLQSPIEFHIAFEREHDVYGLWAIWFVKREDSWRAYRISRQDW